MHATTAATATKRAIVIADGTQAMADLAALVCGDARLAPLLRRLNPRLPAFERLRAGTEVMCPTNLEVQRHKNTCKTYSDEDAVEPSGSMPRRVLGASPSVSQHARPAAEAMARALAARGVQRGEIARRLAQECEPQAIAALARHADPALRAAGEAAELVVAFPLARRRLRAVRGLLLATARPGGFRALLEASARSRAEAAALLDAIAIAPALRDALGEAAPELCRLLARAREIVQLERGARDAALRSEPAALRALVLALGDGVEPLGGERLAAIGLAAEEAALLEHLRRLDDAFAVAERALPRSPAALRALQGAPVDGALARPWPLVVRVCRALAPRMEVLPPSACDEGLGGLVPRKGTRVSAEGEPVRVRVADLAARAAACARVDDEGDALAARLAAAVVELFGLMGPMEAEGCPAPVRRARRRAAFDRALVARGAVSGEGAAVLVAEVLERARVAGVEAALRLRAPVIEAAADAARALPGELSVLRRPMSELGRALVVAAMVLDRDLAPRLARPTGRESFVQAATRHAGRVLSAAACRVAAAP